MPELTGPQISVQPSYADSVPKLSLKKLRRMRKDPVISLVRRLFFSGILSGEWSYEGEDPDMVQLIEDQFRPLRRHFLATGALGCFDFGWQPYEKVIEVNPVTYDTQIKKLKPLLQDLTEIIEDDKDGSFKGLKNGDAELPLEKCLLLNWDVEGTNWEGQSTLENAEGPYDQSTILTGAVQRFDKKMAGAHWVIKYPDGKSTFEGKETPNHEIATAVLKSLMSSGGVTIPQGKAMFGSGDFKLENPWNIELVSAVGAVVDFNVRFDYLDKSKARALGFPERSILEGLHGTKAEAGVHGDFVITMIEYRHECLLEQLNWHLVNQILRLNYGEQADNLVVIKASPINDGDRALIASIYDKILTNPDGFLREIDNLDTQAMSDTLGIPRNDMEIEDGDELPEGLPA